MSLEEFKRSLNSFNSLTNSLYKDRKGNDLSFDQYADLHKDPSYCRIGEHIHENYWISTVWLGLVHRNGMIFETMIFDASTEADFDFQQRYRTEQEAVDGHADIVEKIKDPKWRKENLREILMNKELALTPSTDEMNVYQLMAKTAANSKLFDKIGGEAGLLSIMLMARELGLPPMQSLMGGMNIIQGKVELSPRLMNSMIRKAGHKIEITESTDQKCTLTGTRHDTKETYSCSFTIDDAKRASLIRSGGGWEKFASDMLFARCLSRLARRLFADIISTAYIEGEIDRVEPTPPASESEQNKGTGRPFPSDNIERAEVVETVVIVAKELTTEEFCAALKSNDKVGDKYHLLDMDEYLKELTELKGVPIHKIKEQALNPILAERFCKSWKIWYDAKSKDAEEALNS